MHTAAGRTTYSVLSTGLHTAGGCSVLGCVADGLGCVIVRLWVGSEWLAVVA